eukprot:Plantae.Rhodophyta-Hildenbrandia_rubra.ctg5487.p1 GENE.Plantae.Rhodophyta-Hildenbrandia_rubra.ctg5487~~Plantae.Rhodophyta-Hildenbrandia_rubra.ctg5487.p1  ORF type:complete len:361 (-),score=32.27 Plantae.Rhodophyta-Hildenbrandia_rubra.ctg5487:845-1927(-)
MTIRVRKTDIGKPSPSKQRSDQDDPSKSSAMLLNYFTRSDIELVVCALGIYGCYLYYGYLQERIYKTSFGPEQAHFTHSSFLVFVQTLTNASIAALVLLFVPQKPHSTPIHKYFLVALTYLSAMLFSFSALRHMSYPMQALGKSCKMIPVMLLGVVIRKKRYTTRDYACVGLITFGVALFSFKRQTDKQSHTSPLGLGLLFASLLMDGITGPTQESLVAQYGPSTHQLMFFQNIASSCWLFLLMIVTSDLLPAINFVKTYPEILKDILAFSLVSAFGQNFIFYTVRNFSALACTTITTTRKFFTILISILIYKHTLSSRQWVAVFMVFTGIIWEVIAKHRKKRNGAAAISNGAPAMKKNE